MSAERDFVISRTYDAPRDLVWQAWTDPERMSRWWGPATFETPLCEMDLRPGGAYRIVMRSPEGVDYPIKGEFCEIAEPGRIVMTLDCSEHPAEWHDFVKPDREKPDANPAGMMTQTATFEEQDGRTALTIRTRFESAAIHDAMLAMGMTEGWSQSLDRLDSLLADAQDIISTRHFGESRDFLFEAFRDPDQLVHWWGPKGFTNTFHEFDPKPGGPWRFTMHGPDGATYDNEKIFLEVVPPERIVFQHVEPMHRFKMTMTFAGEDGGTRLTWRMRFEPAAEGAKFRDFILGANEQNFDRLESHLEERRTLIQQP